MAVLTPVEVRDELAAQLDELADLTRRLVAIDSPTDAPAGVAAVLALLGEALRDSGCTVQRIDVGGGLFVLDATLDLGPGPTVLILGHADPAVRVHLVVLAEEGAYTAARLDDMQRLVEEIMPKVNAS